MQSNVTKKDKIDARNREVHLAKEDLLARTLANSGGDEYMVVLAIVPLHHIMYITRPDQWEDRKLPDGSLDISGHPNKSGSLSEMIDLPNGCVAYIDPNAFVELHKFKQRENNNIVLLDFHKCFENSSSLDTQQEINYQYAKDVFLKVFEQLDQTGNVRLDDFVLGKNYFMRNMRNMQPTSTEVIGGMRYSGSRLFGRYVHWNRSLLKSIQLVKHYYIKSSIPSNSFQPGRLSRKTHERTIKTWCEPLFWNNGVFPNIMLGDGVQEIMKKNPTDAYDLIYKLMAIGVSIDKSNVASFVVNNDVKQFMEFLDTEMPRVKARHATQQSQPDIAGRFIFYCMRLFQKKGFLLTPCERWRNLKKYGINIDQLRKCDTWNALKEDLCKQIKELAKQPNPKNHLREVQPDSSVETCEVIEMVGLSSSAGSAGIFGVDDHQTGQDVVPQLPVTQCGGVQ